MMTPERTRRFVELLRSTQPKTLIDGRLGAAGDYVSTGDNVIPANAPADAWEVPATINHTWGFRKDDRDWKSPGDITFKLVDIVSKGGNYLLNVGPMADGIIPPASQDSLREVGKWLKVNGEAIYGAGPSPWGEEAGEPSAKGTKDLRGQPLFLSRNEWRATTRPGKVFFTFFTEPRVPFALPPMKNAVKRVYRLADGVPVETKADGGQTTLVIPRPILDPMATVVVVEIEGDTVTK
jgi:alpha-L-fucosidase